MHTVLSTGFRALAAFAAVVSLTAADKVSRSVERAAASAEFVDVFVMGSYQPSREIAARWRDVAGAQIEIEDRAARALNKGPVAVAALAEQARDRRDAALVDLRQRVAANIAAEVTPYQDQLVSRLEGLGATRITRLRLSNLVGARIPSAALESLAADHSVARIFDASPARLHLDISTQSMGAPAFWGEGFTGNGESLVVIDTGIRADHSAFAGKNVESRAFLSAISADPCFADDPSSGNDIHGHGTHVSGIAASQGIGRYRTLVGVGRGVNRLYSLKAAGMLSEECGGQPIFYTSDWFDAVEWALTETPARIFNLSFGAAVQLDDNQQDLFLDLMADTFDAIFAVAAGNSGPGPNTVGIPGNSFNAITVANVNDHRTAAVTDDEIARSSSRGPTETGRFKPDIAAPGSDITSADALHGVDDWVSYTGTSMAAPHIAGAAALLCQAGVGDLKSVKALLVNSATGGAWNADFGWGAANLGRALAERANVVRSSLTKDRPVRFWRGQADGNLRSTLVWNRHVEVSGDTLFATLNALDLYLHDPAGKVMAESTLPGQNVEKFESSYRGDAIVRVSPALGLLPGTAREDFSLALSKGGWTELAGPRLAWSCQTAATVVAGEEVDVECTATNGGDLGIQSVQAVAAVHDGFRSTGSSALGAVAPGASVSRRFRLRAPEVDGNYKLHFNATALGFGEKMFAEAMVAVHVSPSPLPVFASSVPVVELTMKAGGDDAYGEVRVTLSGDPAPFTASASGASWLHLPRTRFGATPDTIGVVARGRLLAPGVYEANIVVSGKAANSPFTIPVRLTVTP